MVWLSSAVNLPYFIAAQPAQLYQKMTAAKHLPSVYAAAVRRLQLRRWHRLHGAIDGMVSSGVANSIRVAP